MDPKTTNLPWIRLALFCILNGLFAISIFSCAQQKEEDANSSVTHLLKIQNPLDQEREEELIVISSQEMKNKFPESKKNQFRVYADEEEIPSQWNENGNDVGLAFVLPKIGASETIELKIVSDEEGLKPEYSKRTQAELSHKFGGEFKDREYFGGHFENVNSLSVPAEHTDHSWFIRYEGPGWESDLVGYRFYLDWRNGIDVFGKKVKTPVLQDVGQDGFDSYHEPADWGMDVLKVGKTLGLGSIATFENGAARRVDVTDSLFSEITNNGPIYSSVFTTYFGWDLPGGKTDILSNISIHAGTRLSRMDLKSTNAIENFATGLIKDTKAEFFTSSDELEYGYIASYGPQSLAEDNLGIAVIYPTALLQEKTSDDLSHVLVFDGSSKKLSYYFLAAWEQEPGGITSREAFQSYLDKIILEKSNPLKVSF